MRKALFSQRSTRVDLEMQWSKLVSGLVVVFCFCFFGGAPVACCCKQDA